MFVRATLVSAVALVCALVPVRVSAQPDTQAKAPALTWAAPAACPSGDVMERVAGLVGVEPDRLASKLLRVDAVVSPGIGGGWRTKLRIETAAGSGERSFDAEDCASLIKGAALIVALTVDPSATPVVESPEGSPKAERPRAGASARPLFLLRPLLAADWGGLPDVALAYGGAVGIAWPSLRFEVDGLYQSAQTVSGDRGHTGRVRVPLSSGARACLPWRLGENVEPAACLGAGLTWLRSTGGGTIAFPETHDSLAVTLTGGAALGWRLRDWLWLRAEASLGLMVRRPRLQVHNAAQGADDVYVVRQLTARLAGGLELRL